jgi:AraC family transcriptional regulator
MNAAIGYIEEHLTDGIDPDAVARILACPYTVFQRWFGPIAGVPFSEYVRRRKLSRAARDLRDGMRVIDAAVLYGYESAGAFSVAFKRLHGIPAQEAKRPDANFVFYPRMVFSLTIMGGAQMDYRVLEREAFAVAGVRRTTPTGGGTWAIVKSDGSMERLIAACGKCDLGLCFGFDAAGNNDYMCGVEWAAEFPGFDRYEYPATTFLAFSAKGAISEGTLGKMWRRIYGEFLPQSEYRQLELPTIERYVNWDDERNECEVEILIPVSK